MLFDGNGNYKPIGSSHEEFIFNPAILSALPSWLTTVGTTPVVTFNAPGASERGSVTLQTKVATPAINDVAGLKTLNLNTALYSEVGFFVDCWAPDSGANEYNSKIEFSSTNGSTTGFYYISDDTVNGAAKFRAYPPAAVLATQQFYDSANVQKRKNLGVVIRPKSGEVFITNGDPKVGGTVVFYSRGFVDSAVGFTFQIQVKFTAAQRSVTLSQIKLRLSHL